MARAPGKFLLLVTAFLVHLRLMPVQSYVMGEEESLYTLGKLKVANLHFFLNDFVTGKNASAVKVAGVSGSNSQFMFGDVYVIDDPLREGVDPTSKEVGNAHGMYAFTGKDRFSLFMAVDFGFTTGVYNGSSISVVSWNPFMETRRELTVVGGRGHFRLARGFAHLTTRYLKGLDAIVEYNVTVLHY